MLPRQALRALSARAPAGPNKHVHGHSKHRQALATELQHIHRTRGILLTETAAGPIGGPFARSVQKAHAVSTRASNGPGDMSHDSAEAPHGLTVGKPMALTLSP